MPHSRRASRPAAERRAPRRQAGRLLYASFHVADVAEACLLGGPCGIFGFLAAAKLHSTGRRSNAPRSTPPPTRISRLPEWLAGATTPSFSMRSTSDAALL